MIAAAFIWNGSERKINSPMSLNSLLILSCFPSCEIMNLKVKIIGDYERNRSKEFELEYTNVDTLLDIVKDEDLRRIPKDLRASIANEVTRVGALPMNEIIRCARGNLKAVSLSLLSPYSIIIYTDRASDQKTYFQRIGSWLPVETEYRLRLRTPIFFTTDRKIYNDKIIEELLYSYGKLFKTTYVLLPPRSSNNYIVEDILFFSTLKYNMFLGALSPEHRDVVEELTFDCLCIPERKGFKEYVMFSPSCFFKTEFEMRVWSPIDNYYLREVLKVSEASVLLNLLHPGRPKTLSMKLSMVKDFADDLLYSTTTIIYNLQNYLLQVREYLSYIDDLEIPRDTLDDLKTEIVRIMDVIETFRNDIEYLRSFISSMAELLDRTRSLQEFMLNIYLFVLTLFQVLWAVLTFK
ncbi:hypothetical protein IPA_06760 [Ignicoccus pacificus DSM 13166]|uniref:Uncharacterized protein n=1 Tax=Ignicoccus pacificus DSM 13166 TaxID=940294 RepID=A0A977PL28_9CREN|nr:hypothetical protein IPA_06760 [Ignicoccus pacificus DSM 13166]